MKGEIDQPRRDLPERTFAFARRVVKLCQVLDRSPGVCRTLANQLLRSGTSIGANVEEAVGGSSKKDFLHKITISYKEARESLYWLRLISEFKVKDRKQVDDAISLCNELLRIIGTIQLKMKDNENKTELN